MKKIIISTLAIMLAVPAFATGISPNDTGDNMCVYDVLSTYTGPANLQAGWQANTIQLKWYNGDTQLNVQSAANSCTYESSLTIPSTQPTKTGYTFAGWKIKAAAGGLCGLTSSILNTDGTDLGYKSGAYSYNETIYGLTSDQTWAVEFEHGIVRGTASCNSTQPSYDWDSYYDADDAIWDNESLTDEQKQAQADVLLNVAWADSGNQSPSGAISSSGTGEYCWCHAESYTPNGGSQCSLASIAWMFNYDTGPAGCADGCADTCSFYIKNFSGFRLAVLGVAAN